MAIDSTQRFSDRVANYVRYRPSYPEAVIEILRQRCGFQEGMRVADVGSGTGISSKLLLDAGATVIGVEPNDAMRQAAERDLGSDPCFKSVSGTAEATTLPDESVDLVVAGQAFHWFDPARARTEFARILRLPKPVALFWNTRSMSGSSFIEGYEAILREYATDYAEVRHDGQEENRFRRFFGDTLNRDETPNAQRLDYEGLKGRLLSSSYAPTEQDSRYAPMLTALRKLFDDHAEGGMVEMPYTTEVFSGFLSDRSSQSRAETVQGQP